MRAIWSIAATTVGEAVRRRVLLIILLIGAAFLVIAPGLGMLSARQETTILRSMMLGIIQMTAAVIAVVLTVYMIPNEIERRTIYTILCKPVQRWQFLIGKYLGAVMALGLMMALMTGLMLGMYYVQKRVVDINEYTNLAKAPMMYFVQMSLLAAVAVFFSTFVSPLVNFFLAFGVFGVGQFFNTFLEVISKSQATSPILKIVVQTINTILPNFGNYNVQNPIINPGVQIQNETMYFITATGYGLIYITILLVLGIIVFDRREV